MDRFVGKRLDGRYEIQEILGVGGMAVVYRAYDNQENRIVAVKILKEEFTSNEEFLRRFKNESKAIAMLAHQNIVKVYDVSFGDLIQYIVMEYIEGITLKEFIEQEGSLSWRDAVHFTMQILRALQHAHDKGIVHRDVKPQNIMVLSDGTIKVTDFGIARFAHSDQRTMTDKAIGSVHYISPEQARGEKTDEKADIYSVGVILYEMLTGKLPFQAESAVSVAIMQLQREPQLPTEINPYIPRGIEQITMHAMQKTPERRYQSAGEMLCDVDRFRKDPSLTFEYGYFVDSSPTRFVGGTDINKVSRFAELPEEEPAKEKNTIVPILAGIAITLLIALVVLAIIFIPKLFSATGEEIECPNFVGKSVEEINNIKAYTENFNFNVEWSENEDFAYGVVYQQSETAGEKLKSGATITLYASMGQTTIRVPDVYGKTEAAAVSELKSQGFKHTIVEMASEDVDEGNVIRTEPQRTEVVAVGQTVTIYVSTGKPEKEVTVQDVVGMTSEAAQELLQGDGLIVEVVDTQITFEDKYYPLGYVVGFETEDDKTTVLEGSTVKLLVCTGYSFDLTVDELPIDFISETYYLTLWKDGTLYNNGNKVDSQAISEYTFEGVVIDTLTADFTVRISSDGITEYNLFDYSVDVKSGRIKMTASYGYPVIEPGDNSEPTGTESDITSSDDGTQNEDPVNSNTGENIENGEG